MSFAAAVARMDAEADTRLGDPLFYHLGGIISTETVQGTISDPSDLSLIGLDTALDQVGQRFRLEIHRDLVPLPSKNDRINSDHALLKGYTWRPANWRPNRSGRYWIMDLQKVGQ